MINKTLKEIKLFIQNHRKFFQAEDINEIRTKAKSCARPWHFFCDSDSRGIFYRTGGTPKYYIWLPNDLARDGMLLTSARSLIDSSPDSYDVMNPKTSTEAFVEGWSWVELDDTRMDILDLLINTAEARRNV